MERFQIRQLQRMPSSMTVGLDGLVSDFAGTPSAGVTTRTPRSQQHTEHYLHPRPSSRNVSEHFSSASDIGLKTGSFRHFGDTPSFIGGGHPPLESGTSNAQLMEQFNLSHGDLGHPYNDPKLNDPVLSSLQRRFVCRHPGGYSRVRSVVPSGDRFSHFTRTYTCDYCGRIHTGIRRIGLTTNRVRDRNGYRCVLQLADSMALFENSHYHGRSACSLASSTCQHRRVRFQMGSVCPCRLDVEAISGRGCCILVTRISFVSLVSWLWSSVSRTTSHVYGQSC
ncbi:hypothetical protein JG688_00012005 [Phytophthora aleatoria]|uniref:Uncharacterized protein n=1 Tax=Phytophthora aleatoria TaxID=2496075 RepID=A0A8J5IJK7_9STRA|nr:hypothetical protein JG688_00012005 [Phytophthora aleatoria]